jgi:hypothetical protein
MASTLLVLLPEPEEVVVVPLLLLLDTEPPQPAAKARVRDKIDKKNARTSELLQKDH